MPIFRKIYFTIFLMTLSALLFAQSDPVKTDTIPENDSHSFYEFNQSSPIQFKTRFSVPDQNKKTGFYTFGKIVFDSTTFKIEKVISQPKAEMDNSSHTQLLNHSDSLFLRNYELNYLTTTQFKYLPVTLILHNIPYYIAHRRQLYAADLYLTKPKKNHAPKDSVDHSTKNIRDRFSYSFETGAFYSINNSIPFWQKSNQFGAVPQKGNSLYFRQMIESKTDISARFFDADYCVDILTVVGSDTRLVIPEAFLKLHFGKLTLGGGRFKNVMGIVDTTYSSGSITWSGNSLPLPEIRLEIAQYQKLFVRWLGYKGHFTHAWFGNQTFVKGYYLHQKSLYGRIGSDKSKLHLYAGILHNVQWGGAPKYKVYDPDFILSDGKFPSDWFTFKQVVLPYKTLSDTTLGYGGFEVENRFGNHLSQIDLAADYYFGDKRIMLYKNNIIETGRTLGSFSNLDDGLYGFSYRNSNEKAFIRNLVVEYLFSMNQGSYNALIARLLKKPLKDYGNNAFYFNHQQYYDGWSYGDQTIGTPFFIPDKELVIQNNHGPAVFSNSNRMKVWYLATSLKLNSILLEAKGSYSQNYGSFLFPITSLNQLNTNFKFIFPLKTKNTFLNIQVGIDHGEYIRDNYGINVSYRRNW